jgi:hypothetical protein
MKQQTRQKQKRKKANRQREAQAGMGQPVNALAQPDVSLVSLPEHATTRPLRQAAQMTWR